MSRRQWYSKADSQQTGYQPSAQVQIYYGISENYYR